MRLLLFFIHAFVASATELAWRELPSGVCADGTPAGYYDDATGFDGSEPWAIYFQGGGFADSADEALDRVQAYFATRAPGNPSPETEPQRQQVRDFYYAGYNEARPG